MTSANDSIWNGAYKIPWDDPDFSRRMLAQHLTQHHDLASRRLEWINQQVGWIHQEMLSCVPSDVLDLGCGPGLYSHRLTSLGHRCRGIDFGPASIDYARRHNPDAAQCEFVLGDIRRVDYGGPHDLAMILYGELNAFAPDEAADMICRAYACLRPGGRLIVEVSSFEAVECLGLSEPSDQQSDCGLFSDQPHRCTIASQWLSEEQVAIQTFTITESGSGREQIYRSTTRAWKDDELIARLRDSGFGKASRRSDWPSNTDGLALWVAEP